MDATDKTLSGILPTTDQFIIPVFQRYYIWDRSNWQQLWDDLAELLESEDHSARHFLGSIVCVPNSSPRPGMITAYQVIDGQQRLTTLSLLLCAMRDYGRGKGWRLGEKINDSFLVQPHEDGITRYRVFPRLRDRHAYLALIDGDACGEDSLLAEAYQFFLERLQEYEDEQRLEELFNALIGRVDMVVITLDGENPFKIFKSLNSTGVALEEADLIRNHVFMSMPLDEQDRFDEDYWQPLESRFEKEDDNEEQKLDAKRFGRFFRDVMMRHGKYVPKNSTYEAFEARFPFDTLDAEALAQEYSAHARHYNIIDGREEHADPAIDEALSNIRKLQATTAYPLILRMMEMVQAGQMSLGQLRVALEMIAGFVLRRFICHETSRQYHRWFVAASRRLGDTPVANLHRYFKSKGWPSDKRFVEEFVGYPIYSSKYARPILDRLELDRQAASERVLLEKCSIEHIMPQTINTDAEGEPKDADAKAWKKDLEADLANDEDWQEVYESWLDTIGNLTLVGHDYNSKMQKKPFAAKRPVLARSKIYLNEYFSSSGEPTAWNRTAIQRRGEVLAEKAVELWIGPNAPRIERAYSVKTEAPSTVAE